MSTGNNYGGFCPTHHQHFPCPVCLSATPPEGETAIEEFTRLHPAEMAAARANIAVTADYERQIASLKAERDSARSATKMYSTNLAAALGRAEDAEAEVERLREALERLEIQARWVKSIAEADYGMKCTELGLAIDSAAALSPTNPSGAVASSEREDSDTKH